MIVLWEVILILKVIQIGISSGLIMEINSDNSNLIFVISLKRETSIQKEWSHTFYKFKQVKITRIHKILKVALPDHLAM